LAAGSARLAPDEIECSIWGRGTAARRLGEAFALEIKSERLVGEMEEIVKP
jgi:hypothetical protein